MKKRKICIFLIAVFLLCSLFTSNAVAREWKVNYEGVDFLLDIEVDGEELPNSVDVYLDDEAHTFVGSLDIDEVSMSGRDDRWDPDSKMYPSFWGGVNFLITGTDLRFEFSWGGPDYARPDIYEGGCLLWQDSMIETYPNWWTGSGGECICTHADFVEGRCTPDVRVPGQDGMPGDCFRGCDVHDIEPQRH